MTGSPLLRLLADLGGTSLRLVLCDESGTVYGKALLPTPRNTTPDEFVQLIYTWAESKLGERGLPVSWIVGVGIAIAGPVDMFLGVVAQTPNVWAVRDAPLRNIVHAKFGTSVEVLIVNDGDAAVVGEQALGAAQGLDTVLFLTWSTGIGSGIYAQGRLIPGSEIGHVVVDPSAHAYVCGCGVRGHLEGVAGGRAIAKRLSRLAKHDIELRDYIAEREPTAQLACEAARAGHLPARRIVVQAAVAMGSVLANMTSALRPQRIVFGGSLWKAEDLLRDPMVDAIQVCLMPGIKFEPDIIVRAELGEQMGIVGCQTLLDQALGKRGL